MAFSRYHYIDAKIKPDKIGRFVMFIKSIDFLHITPLSHYPQQVTKDHQKEYVAVYKVEVR
jgi:hypothetical protein